MAAPGANSGEFQLLLQEAESLARHRPRCHYTSSDLQCIVLISKLHAAGYTVSLEDARGCVERIRIAVETGEYPCALLHTQEAGLPPARKPAVLRSSQKMARCAKR